MISGSITGGMDFAKYGADPDGYADRGRGWQESAGGAAADLREQNRENAGYTAPACGLMLMEVHY